jgi:hypothetical protein
MSTPVETEEQKSSIENIAPLQHQLEISTSSSSPDRDRRVSLGDLSGTLLKDSEIPPAFYRYLVSSSKMSADLLKYTVMVKPKNIVYVKDILTNFLYTKNAGANSAK